MQDFPQRGDIINSPYPVALKSIACFFRHDFLQQKGQLLSIRVYNIIINYLHLFGRSLGNATQGFLQRGEFPQYPKWPALESFLGPPNSPLRFTASHGEK